MQIRNAQRFLSFSVLGLTGVAFSSSLFAAGFALRNHTASGVGTSLASDTVNTFDASGLGSNPAIMSQFKGTSLSLNVNYTDANIKAKDATLTAGPSLGRAMAAVPGSTLLQGKNGESDVSEPVIIPSIFGIHQLNEQAHVGWSFNVPYGTNTQYDNDWAGRYHGTKTDLKAYELALHGSYKLDDMIALGLTLGWQQAKGELASAADLGGANFAATAARYAAGQATLQDVGAASAHIGRADAIATYKGDSTAFVFGVGALYTPMAGTRIGFNYKGAVKHEASGDFKYATTNATSAALLTGFRASAQSARFSDSDDAKLNLELPPVASIGLSQDVSEMMTVYANVTHTGWSTISELNPEYNGVEVVTQLRWNDSVYYAIGGDYRFTPEVTFRAGVGRDQGVTDTDHRTPRTPDGDRTAVSLGASYKSGPMDFTFSYQQLFLDTEESELKAAAYADADFRGTLKAKYEINPSIAAVSAGYSF